MKVEVELYNVAVITLSASALINFFGLPIYAE